MTAQFGSIDNDRYIILAEPTFTLKNIKSILRELVRGHVLVPKQY